MPERFAGRVALVTGGAGGIGGAVARRLIAEGANVAVFDVVESDLPQVVSIVGDISDSSEVNRAVADVERAFGAPDILVCCAGITGTLSSPLELSDAEWNRVMGINASGVFYSMRAALPAMVARGYGRVVNLASISAKEGLPDADAYAASKAAVVSLTRTVGRAVAGSGVLVNCVAPTVVETPMIENLSTDYRATALSRIPLARFGQVDELAAMIAWMASDEMTYSTGMCFDFSGGRANY